MKKISRKDLIEKRKLALERQDMKEAARLDRKMRILSKATN
jgi:hypothetical protein